MANTDKNEKSARDLKKKPIAVTQGQNTNEVLEMDKLCVKLKVITKAEQKKVLFG